MERRNNEPADTKGEVPTTRKTNATTNSSRRLEIQECLETTRLGSGIALRIKPVWVKELNQMDAASGDTVTCDMCDTQPPAATGSDMCRLSISSLNCVQLRLAM